MEVLGAYLSPFVSVKDRFTVHPHVMLNACLALSWSDKSFWPWSQVAQLRPGPLIESAYSGGSKDVRRANGVSPSASRAWSSWRIGRISEGVALIGPVKLVPELYQRWPNATPTGKVWVFVLGITPQLVEIHSNCHLSRIVRTWLSSNNVVMLDTTCWLWWYSNYYTRYGY
jgi:hypothetical protein